MGSSFRGVQENRKRLPEGGSREPQNRFWKGAILSRGPARSSPDQGKEGALRLKTGKVAFRLRFRKEEAPRVMFSAGFEEFHTGNALGIVSDRWEIGAGASVAAQFRICGVSRRPMAIT